MKCLVAVLLSMLATAIAAPEISNDKFFENYFKNFGAEIDDYWKIVKRKVFKENNTDFEIPLKEVFKRATELDQTDFYSMTVCTLLKTKLIYITEPMVTAIDGCVRDDFAGIGDFTVNYFGSFFDTICGYSVEEYLEIWNPCTVNADFLNCVEVIDHKMRETTKENSKRTLQFCSAYRELIPCMEEATNKNCKLEITQKARSGIMDSILRKPCAI